MAKYHFLKHFHTVNKHRFHVFINCTRCGFLWRGLVHDLSKYSPTEFITSAKYYQGTRTPIHAERLDNEYYSHAFVHHTAKNRHHYEYWVDFFRHNLVLSPIPYPFAVEYCCDVISASQVYNGKNFNRSLPLDYFQKAKHMALMHPATIAFVIEVLSRYKETGFKNIKRKDTKKIYQEKLSEHPDNIFVPFDLEKSHSVNDSTEE